MTHGYVRKLWRLRQMRIVRGQRQNGTGDAKLSDMRGQYDWVTDDGKPSPPANILCNLAIGGSWAGRNGVDNDAMPQSFDVEYIHVYQRLKQSTIGVDLMPK